jgi:putative transposase
VSAGDRRPLQANGVSHNYAVGRDSVEPTNDRCGRANPAEGVYIFGDAPTIAFLTICTLNRAIGLAEKQVHHALLQAWADSSSWSVGAYVIMPDHIHLFCQPQTRDVSIEHWIAFWKRRVRRLCPLVPRFQSRGFHHRLRRGENYSEKWEYVRNNPVRARLVREQDEWPFQGVLNNLPWWD